MGSVESRAPINYLQRDRVKEMDAKTLGNQCAYTSFVGDPGLTKRELFAAMVFQGYAADPNSGNGAVQPMAAAAVMWADALLAELAKETAK
jgi:hypothetical protein